MRRAAYAGASVAATVAVVLRAFHERPNFYSACVYLGQSTACRMILLNMLLLTLGTTLYGLQRLLYGRLRAIEIEQLWDKAWYAITETALAMTTFRDEVGGYFFVMFMTLLAGKVWGWIGEGRVETLEQQPPANPKLFHTRLVLSMALSQVFDFAMLNYCVTSILDQHPPRAGMMIMFAFEFAILAISSTSTTVRYLLALQEKMVIRQQTKVRMEERREELRAARENAARHEELHISSGEPAPPARPAVEEEIDENEIDVPGWQEKGKFILFLDLTTEFLKLILYLGFFLVLLFFAGIPIHMFRDLFVTGRSFIKRINDYRKYRNATRDMNSRYADATAEELDRDGTCIICREEMRLWQPRETNAAGRPNRTPPDERQRPKKLPCGHILHFGCLRSWLERQQVCPTCRRSVLTTDIPRPSANNDNNHNHPPRHPLGQQNNNRQGRDAGPQPPANDNQPQRRNGNAQAFQNALGQRHGQLPHQDEGAMQGGESTQTALRQAMQQINQRQHASSSRGSITDEIGAIEGRIMQEMQTLSVSSEQLVTVRALQNELTRLRQTAELTQGQVPQASAPGLAVSSQGSRPMQSLPVHPRVASQQEVLMGQRQQMLGQGHADLPSGMTLPEGWSLMPLQRLGGGAAAREGETATGEGGATRFEPISVVPQASLPSGIGQAVQTEIQQRPSTTEAPAGQPTPTPTTASQPEEAEASAVTSHNGIAESTPSIPDWSTCRNNTAIPESTNGDIHEQVSGSAKAESSETGIGNGHAPEDKGKGRAASVEDEDD